MLKKNQVLLALVTAMVSGLIQGAIELHEAGSLGNGQVAAGTATAALHGEVAVQYTSAAWKPRTAVGLRGAVVARYTDVAMIRRF